MFIFEELNTTYMKKVKILLAAAIAMGFVSACKNIGRHVTIVTDNNGVKTSMEYSGKIAFTEDMRAIKSMAPNSYIKIEKDGQQLIAERRQNKISYRLNNGPASDTLNAHDKQLMAYVIKKLDKMDTGNR